MRTNLVKEYLVYAENISEMPAETAKILFKSQDKESVREFLLDRSDEDTTVKIYYVNEDGEFVVGSDYDIPSNFLKNIELR